MSEFLFIYFAAALSAAIFLLATVYPKIRSRLRQEIVKDLSRREEIQPMLDHYIVIGLILGFNFFVFMPKYITVILMDHYKNMYVEAYVTGVLEK
jgi:hypothetical protein